MRTTLLLVAAVTAGSAALAAPASAADTLVTVPVGVAGTLSIAAPVAVVTPGEPASAAIATTVTDARLSGTGWVASISATALTLVGATSPGATETIPASSLTAYTGVVAPTVPGVVTISAPYTSSAPLSLSGTAAAFVTASSRNNVNTAIYTATVSIPTTGKTAGVYTGTVTAERCLGQSACCSPGRWRTPACSLTAPAGLAATPAPSPCPPGIGVALLQVPSERGRRTRARGPT